MRDDGSSGYPWIQGEQLLATDLNAAIASASAIGNITGLGGIVDGRNYGIKADGVTDDTAALTAAIAAAQAPSSGAPCSRLVLPKGRILTGPQVLGYEIFIQGAQDNSTALVLKNGSSAACLTINPAGSAFPGGAPRGHIVLQDLRIENQTIKTGNAAAHGISLVQSSAWTCHVSLQHVTVYAMPGDGIDSLLFRGWVDCYDCSIFNNLGYGVNCNSCSDWHWYGGDVAVNGIAGVLLAGCSQFVFTGTNIYSNGTQNLYLYGAPGAVSGNNSFVSCMFDRGNQVGVLYDMRGTSGASFEGCTFGLCSQVTPNTYSDVLISSDANSLAKFSRCFWGNNNANDATATEKWALEFQGTTSTVVVDETNTYFGGTLRVSNPLYVFVMAGAGTNVAYGSSTYLSVNQGGIAYTTAIQYAGYSISNGTNVVAKLSGFSAANDTGVLVLSSAGKNIVQLSAAGPATAANFINNDLWLGPGASSATPLNRVLRATDGLGTDIIGADLTLSAGRSTGAGNGGTLRLRTAPAGTTGATQNAEADRLTIDQRGNVVVNTSALATTATNGFLYIPTCAGTPTGAPTAYTGRVPIVFDSSANKIWVYNGTWKQTVALT